MHFWDTLIIGTVAALAAFNAIEYARTPGTVAERLAACWRDSLTVFMGVWGGIATALTLGLDVLAQITGAPEFQQLANAVQAAIPAQYHPWVPVGALIATTLARFRTLPPKK